MNKDCLERPIVLKHYVLLLICATCRTELNLSYQVSLQKKRCCHMQISFLSVISYLDLQSRGKRTNMRVLSCVTHPSSRLPTCPSARPPIRPSVCLFARPPVCLSARPPVLLSTDPPVLLSAHPPVQYFSNNLSVSLRKRKCYGVKPRI